MRIFTCTPFAFGGGPDFFARDSGLLCRGLQAVGVESRAVMPGTRMPEDEDDLIRTEYGDLESAEWWRSMRLDAVVLYSWGRPRYRKVAGAIHEAGIFLILNQDNGGLISPLAGFTGWVAEQRNLTGGGSAFMARVIKGLSYGLLLTDPLRARHLKQGDVIACVSPKAAEHYRRLCELYGGKALENRVRVLPHAVEPLFQYDGRPKNHQVACVGRWNDEIQKRPRLLMEIASMSLDADDSIRWVIVGDATAEMHAWHASLPVHHRCRVDLPGRVGRKDLAELMCESMVFYSPSAYESFGIAAAEALCAGCSVVATRSVSMSAFEWFVSGNSGRLAATDSVDDHLSALTEELSSWYNGSRDATQISRTWCMRLHARQVAESVKQMVDSG
jgi:glycosyltransferase involved in cell wall biosynthesis